MTIWNHSTDETYGQCAFNLSNLLILNSFSVAVWGGDINFCNNQVRLPKGDCALYFNDGVADQKLDLTGTKFFNFGADDYTNVDLSGHTFK